MLTPFSVISLLKALSWCFQVPLGVHPDSSWRTPTSVGWQQGYVACVVWVFVSGVVLCRLRLRCSVVIELVFVLMLGSVWFENLVE
jgi:hypothetical protein